MNDNERVMIRYVVDGDIRRAQQWARIVLSGITAKKDEQFKQNMLRKLDAKGDMIELPANLQPFLIAEDMTNFPERKFLLREDESTAVKKIIALYRAAEKLHEMGIPYLPALMLHGQSGCGKTLLARYIAHKADLPFVYVKFSGLMDSYLGKTNANIARVFEYARSAPCVLCIDEIDAIGMARGQKNEVGEMSRIVIGLMQELDRLPNNVIIIGTTNRFDNLDPALARRFPFQYELKPLNADETQQLAQKFFDYAGVDCTEWIHSWCEERFEDLTPASTVVKECTDKIVSNFLELED